MNQMYSFIDIYPPNYFILSHNRNQELISIINQQECDFYDAQESWLLFDNCKSDIEDVNQRKCRKGAVQLPHTLACLDGFVISCHHLNDILLVFGYINKIWNHQKYSNIPLLPVYLIKFISNWLYFEKVHLIGSNWYSNKAHYWTIDIDQILVDSL